MSKTEDSASNMTVMQKKGGSDSAFLMRAAWLQGRALKRASEQRDTKRKDRLL